MPSTTNTPALLSLQQVVKSYPNGDTEVRALDGMDLTIMSGEFVALVGPSGCGKSTLMNILGCLDIPTSGQYVVRGVDVTTLSKDQLALLRRDTFGFIFQRYHLLPQASAIENVEMPAIYAGLPTSERKSRAKALLAKLGLANRLTNKPNQLSGGQQQRVSIARALMNDAAVILADEPTGALDSQSGQEVLALLKMLHQEGRTILLITHDMAIAEHAQRIIRLSDGKILTDNRVSGLSTPAPIVSSQVLTVRRWPKIGEIIRMAMHALQTNIFRTILTLLGVVIGVAAVVAMLAIGEGGKEEVLKRIASMGTNLLVIRPGAPGVRVSGDVATLSTEDTEALRELPNVVEVSPERSKSITVRFSDIDYNTTVRGVWPGYPTVRDWPLQAGGFFTQADLEGYAPVIVLGSTLVKNLFPEGTEPLGQYVLLSNIPFEVIGVMDTLGANAMGMDQDDVALIPLTTGFMRIFGKQYMSLVTVRVAENQSTRAETDIRQLLFSRHKTEDFQVRNTASIMQMASATQNTLTILLGAVAAISLLVGGIGVMNIMLVSVTERTQEIGIRMAVGARTRDILWQFNIEAIAVCGFGGVLGVLIGLFVAYIAQYAGVQIVFSLWPSLFAFTCAFLTGWIFGYVPAKKAAQLDPVVALMGG